jgi:hypothetical protein
MRILANENFPEETIEALREIGHDVIWMHTFSPGKGDRYVLELAQIVNFFHPLASPPIALIYPPPL